MSEFTPIPFWVFEPFTSLEECDDKLSNYEMSANGVIRNRQTLRALTRRVGGGHGKSHINYDEVKHDFEEWTALTENPTYEAKQGSIRSVDRKEEMSVKVRPRIKNKEMCCIYPIIMERMIGSYACSDLINQRGVEFPILQKHLILAYNVLPKNRPNLLVLAHPEFIGEWLGGVDELMTVTKYSNKLYDWKCRFHGEEYQAAMYKKLEGKGCSKCLLNREQRGAASDDNIEKSADTENYLVVALREQPSIQEVTSTGQVGNSKDDVVVMFEGVERCIQVKTLSPGMRNTYQLHMEANYPADMLLYATDAERKYHIVCLCGNIPAKNVGVTFTSRSRTYSQYKFYSLDDAVKEVLRLLPAACRLDSLTQRYGANHEIEIASYKRFQSKCEDLGIVLRLPANNGLAVDCYTGNYGLQLKYNGGNSTSGRQTVTLAHKVKGVKGVPYEVNDGIHFFVIELGTCEGSFLIIPCTALVESGHIRNAIQPGKTGLQLYSMRSSTTNEWSRYWNRFDLLQQ